MYDEQFFLDGRTHEQVSLSKSWHDQLFNLRLLVEENLSIFSRTHEQIKIVKEKLLVCTGFNCGIFCYCYTATITTDTDSSLQHNEGRMLVIVSGTTGAILGALIILVVIVSCQRRLHYHRMRRARLRHRQDQDAFTAFIAYHRDVRLMLPSYDEAINQQEHGQPPTFEEAVGHYEEPSLSPDHTLAGENSPASSLEDAPTPSSTSGSSTHSSVENGSDTFPLVTSPDGQSPPENNRLIRSIRMLFGGRAFRTDAIYCRFVPQEDENEANQNESQAASDSTEDTDLNVVLARAGLC